MQPKKVLAWFAISILRNVNKMCSRAALIKGIAYSFTSYMLASLNNSVLFVKLSLATNPNGPQRHCHLWAIPHQKAFCLMIISPYFHRLTN